MDGIPLSVPRMLDRAAAHGIAIRGDTAAVDETGWDFRVVHGTDTRGRRWILRSPRRAEVVGPAAVEARLLRLLRTRLPTRLPHWHVHEPEFIAYPRLPGSPAGTEDARTLRYTWAIDPCARGADYPDAVARVLAALHAVPPRVATAAGVRHVPAARSREHAARQLDDARAAFGLPAARCRDWRRWLADDDAWHADPVLVHGDVHPGHTLVARSADGGGRLTGLLDWTNARVDDPALDFVDQYYAGGPAVLDAVLDAYRRHGGRVRPRMREHIVARAGFLWVHVSLLGLRTGRPHLVDTAVGHLRSTG
ncbi:macrolide 2'-phosphotransferase [Streptomyces sp. NPDC052114]|uniref:macrolide 2'-phosphotransferase n=1 Tax=unclassified Streptomyces TaxID=2593676 RepID=UPI0034271043